MASEKEAVLATTASESDPHTMFDRSIIKKENPSTVFYEDDEVLAFKDIAPEAPPHIIIIPKARDGLNGLPKAQAPLISSQVGLNNITLGEEHSTQKGRRTKFTPGEDKILVQAWLNVPKNAPAEANKRVDSFWLRIKSYYNEYRGHFKPRGESQLKSRWHKVNSIVHTFVACYKAANEKKKSGSSESDIMGDAYTLYYQHDGEQFKLEHAWRWLKDEPKWLNSSFEGASKRTKISASGAYSTTSNLDTPASCEYNAASPVVVYPMEVEVEKRKEKSKSEETSSVVCLTETEVEKRKGNSKSEETSSANVELIEAQEIPKTKVIVMAEMVLAFKDIAPEAPPHIVIIPKARDGLNGLPRDGLTGLPKAQAPLISSQVGLNNITLGEEQSTQKGQRTKFTPEEDKVLIQAWLKVPKNAAAEANKRVDSFWVRIKNNYNEYRGHFKPRGESQLKARWHRVNSIVHTFVACYKAANDKKKSGSSESDIMGDAYLLYFQHEGEQFKLEYAWRWLKDEPKWSNSSFEGASKRTKISASGAYLTTYNLDRPSSCEYNAVSPIVVFSTEIEVEKRKEKSKSGETSSVVCPTETEVDKRKGKSKSDETSSANVEVIEVQEIPKTKVIAMAEMARVQDEQNKLKEKELNMKEREFELEFLFKDTTGMTARQQRDHEMLCNVIRQKYGIM